MIRIISGVVAAIILAAVVIFAVPSVAYCQGPLTAKNQVLEGYGYGPNLVGGYDGLAMMGGISNSGIFGYDTYWTSLMGWNLSSNNVVLPYVVTAVAKQLNMNESVIYNELHSGATLWQVMQATGKTPQQTFNALNDAYHQGLEGATSAKMVPAQYSSMMATNIEFMAGGSVSTCKSAK